MMCHWCVILSILICGNLLCFTCSRQFRHTSLMSWSGWTSPPTFSFTLLAAFSKNWHKQLSSVNTSSSEPFNNTKPMLRLTHFHIFSEHSKDVFIEARLQNRPQKIHGNDGICVTTSNNNNSTFRVVKQWTNTSFSLILNKEIISYSAVGIYCHGFD